MKNYITEQSAGRKNKPQSNTLFLFPSRLRCEYLQAGSGVESPRFPFGYATSRKKSLSLKNNPMTHDTLPATKLNAELKRCSVAIVKMKI